MTFPTRHIPSDADGPHMAQLARNTLCPGTGRAGMALLPLLVKIEVLHKACIEVSNEHHMGK